MWPFESKKDESAVKLEQAREEWKKRRGEELEARGLREPEEEPQDVHGILFGEADETPLQGTRQLQRLGLNPFLRSAAIGGASFFAGFAVGSAHGATDRALRYRAENAHNAPTSENGWYLYGKSRNYHSIVGGVTEGLKIGARFAGWSVLFIALEEGLDKARARIFARRHEDERLGQRDFLNTVSAAVAVVGIHSRWNNLDRFAAMRSTSLALRYAVPYGLVQDLLSSLRGDPPWYAEWAFSRDASRKRQVSL